MAEYIEREGLMHELGPYEENNFSQEMSVILQIVAGRPAADVAPVVHGYLKNVDIDETYCEMGDCSVCGCWNPLPANYCRGCGARLDKEAR